MLKNLISLNLPQADLKLARNKDMPMVWDDIRKKYLVLTPEEWVRQHFVQYLLKNAYPKSSIALEGGFKVNRQLKRSDILIFKNSVAVALVECKAPQVRLTQETLDQASRYNLHYEVPFIIITNGLEHFYLRLNKEAKAYYILNQLPAYNEL